MRLHTHCLIVFICLASAGLHSQTKQITLEEIWGGAFQTASLDDLRSLKNGKEYTVLNTSPVNNSTSIDVYDYSTGKKVRTLITSAELRELPHIQSYEFSSDEEKILLAGALEPIYRYSTRGRYFIYDIATKSLRPVYNGLIEAPQFSPSGDKIAFVFENNIYIRDLDSNATIQITTDGKKNAIINGVTDWVYEEEFAFVRAFDWNANGTQLAYLKFDETEVPEFSMDIYGTGLYPTQYVFKYPKAGEKNSIVSLHLYDLSSEMTHNVEFEKTEEFYIPRIKWTKGPNLLSVQIMNRHQNDLQLYMVDSSGKVSLTLREIDPAYIDITNDLYFLSDNSYLRTSERSGFNHIYHISEDGKNIKQVTVGDWDVTSFYGFDEKNETIYYQSTENGNINRDVYSIKLDGRNKKGLTDQTGTHDANFSADFSYFINRYSSVDTPPVFTMRNASSGKVIREIANSEALLKKLKDYKISPKEFSKIMINGNELNMYMIKPLDFNPSTHYPLLLFQYSGPGSQQVANRWNGANDYWHQMLAQQGYIIACVDGRGTGYKGSDFKKITQNQLGKYELEDQTSVAQLLGSRNYIDENRIGIWGWSYGGFMAANCILQSPAVFKIAIAVAPVTSWRFYDTIYTERFMTTPEENPAGYDDNSPINHVEKLEGEFLLVHGSADDNVHVQNTMRLISALIQANKPFEWAIYPDKNHGIYGGNTRLHLYNKMTNFIKENL